MRADSRSGVHRPPRGVLLPRSRAVADADRAEAHSVSERCRVQRRGCEQPRNHHYRPHDLDRLPPAEYRCGNQQLHQDDHRHRAVKTLLSVNIARHKKRTSPTRGLVLFFVDIVKHAIYSICTLFYSPNGRKIVARGVVGNDRNGMSERRNRLVTY